MEISKAIQYIFGKLITSGVRKEMFTFAQPPLTLVGNENWGILA